VRRGLVLEPLIHGAGHENGRRAGTESALLAAGLGMACVLANDLASMARMRAARCRGPASRRRSWRGSGSCLPRTPRTAARASPRGTRARCARCCRPCRGRRRDRPACGRRDGRSGCARARPRSRP
jgi:hypothetical protein